jgi:DNA-directed RNA polymerase specialized sigma24 family protein
LIGGLRCRGRFLSYVPDGEMLLEISADVIKQVSRGDLKALGWFYDRWEAPVHAFVARLVRDAEARERVVEAIFWAVWERAGSRGSTPVDEWVHALALACCRAELEQERTRSRGEARRLSPRLAPLRGTNSSNGHQRSA